MREVVHKGSFCDFPTNVRALMDFLMDLLEKVPQEYHDTLHIEFTIDEYYGSDFDIAYERPATEEELEKERLGRLNAARIAADKERALYLSLKEKYDAR